jgi:hypothetical protein
MKYFSAIFVIAILTSCRIGFNSVTGSGNVIKQIRSVEGFTSVEAAGPMDVEIKTGTGYRAEVEADDNLMQYIELRKEGSGLKIRLKDNINIRSNNGIHVYVEMPSVKAIVLSGSGSVKSTSQITDPEEIRLTVGGSGNLFMDVKSPKVDVSIGGSGEAAVRGETRDLDVSIGGSGNFKGEDLKSENAHVSIGGSGDATVNTSVDLDVSVAGSGNVRYRGSPAIKKSILGSGSVTAIH